jgi:formylmethanofuran dehydrogenase subunit E
MGMFAAELFRLDLPQKDKRLFTFMETDGCLVDGIAAATGCWVGSRTMRVMDYGKSAAKFFDTETERALRVIPHPQARVRAKDYAPAASDRWHAQLLGYQVMPTEELLLAQPVNLTLSLSAIISRHGLRVVCVHCGEDIINDRQEHRNGETLCRTCAGDADAYYQLEQEPLALPATTDLAAF